MSSLVLAGAADAPGGGGAAADAPGADAPGGGAADAPVADAFEAAAVGAGACSPSLKGDKGGKRADRQPEQEVQPEKGVRIRWHRAGDTGKGMDNGKGKACIFGVAGAADAAAADDAGGNGGGYSSSATLSVAAFAATLSATLSAAVSGGAR